MVVVRNRNFVIPSIGELINVKKTKAEWDFKTPLEKWCYLYGIGRTGLDILGLPVFRDTMKYYWYSYVYYSYVIVDLILVIYTAYCYISLGEIEKFLPCTALLMGPLACVC